MAKNINPDTVAKALHEGPLSNRELREKLDLSIDKYDPRLDRKLQQLRKEGKILLVGGRWALNTVSTCPTCRGRGWIEKKGSIPAT